MENGKRFDIFNIYCICAYDLTMGKCNKIKEGIFFIRRNHNRLHFSERHLSKGPSINDVTPRGEGGGYSKR